MGVLQPAVGSHAVPVKSHRSRGIFEAGWDLRRFAALAHHDFSTFSSGGPALETSWSPTLKMQIALAKSSEPAPIQTIADIMPQSIFLRWLQI